MHLFLLIGIRFIIVAGAQMAGNLTGRVVDGFDCLPELVPYLVSLQTTYQQVYCGASLVHPYWVVTAAHCCTLSASEYTVYTGLSEMVFSELSHAQSARIKTVIKHKGFTMMPWSSDICLLELETPLRETEKTKFVRVPTPSEYDQLAKQRRCNMSLALGFGYRSIVHANGTAEPNSKSRLLQCVFQRVMTDDYCSKGIAFIDGNTILCTHGNPVVSADTCQGDSGGPLLCQGFQIGIVAAGMGCGLGHESYFTKLSAFYDYIWDHAPVENLGRLAPVCRLTLSSIDYWPKHSFRAVYAEYVYMLVLLVIWLFINVMKGNVEEKIVGGFTCHPETFPYLASIKTINNQIFCGGSVLSKYWVLTAGHCCLPSRAAQYIVYTGLGERRGIVQRSTVREKILHPDFSTFPLSSDICLLKVYKPIRQNARTVFIKIANTALYNEMIQSGICNHSLTLGFGTQNILYKNLTKEHRKYNPKLQCIYQKIMPHNYCAGNALIDRTILCTLSSMDSEEADVCKGDSGGPLVCHQVQIGIVSSGRGCGIGTPSFFTRVDVFSDFISKHTNGSSNWLTTFAFIVFILVFMNI